MENLDRICAEYGYKFAEQVSNVLGPKKAESFITKALGVLQEQGLYAFALFCEKEKNDGGKVIIDLTKELLQSKLQLIGNEDLLKEIRKENGLASELDKLLFAIQILEKSLIYTRYHAKALSELPNESERTKEGESQ